uniref:Uncharacterized protein n=1 Tax=Anguilla anguilla TaxID=7936 RepID=A0A0E9VAI2_ANGAN
MVSVSCNQKSTYLACNYKTPLCISAHYLIDVMLESDLSDQIHTI